MEQRDFIRGVHEEALLNALATLGTPSLKSIARVCGVADKRLYNLAKKPRDGHRFSAYEYNWLAVANWLFYRLEDCATSPLYSFETLIKEALRVDTEISQLSAPRLPANLSPDRKFILVEGKQYPTRRFRAWELPKPGEEIDPAVYPQLHPHARFVVLIRHEPQVFKICHQSSIFTVLQPIDEHGNFSSELVRIMGNNNLNLHGLNPYKLRPSHIEQIYSEQKESLA
jgi:hypothetical protein